MITLLICLIGCFFFRESFLRLGEAFRDFGLSVVGLFCSFAGITTNFSTDTVNNPSKYVDSIVPIKWDEASLKMERFFNNLVDADNILEFVSYSSESALIASYVILLLLLPMLVMIVLIKLDLSGHNTLIRQSTPLRIYLSIERKIKPVIVENVRSFTDYVKDTKWRKLWLALIVFILNGATIIVELIAFYFYFLSVFEFDVVWMQIYKLLADLSILSRVPLGIWIIIGVIFLLWWRKRIAIKRLNDKEACNCNLIENMIHTVVVIWATMGAGKTELLTDIILTKLQIMRKDALAIVQEVTFEFPNFSWISFDRYLEDRFDNHVLYNLSGIKRHIRYLRKVYTTYQNDVNFKKFYDRQVRKGRVAPLLFGYEVNLYGIKHDNGLIYENIFDAMSDYAQAYYLYRLGCSMAISNYGIVSKDIMTTEGNFPLWIMDFFNCPSFDVEEDEHQMSHILDNNMLRLGKKIPNNLEYANAMDFGAVGYMEADKERGNMLDTMELKKLVEEANQKNDGFNADIKMSRHFSSVRHRRFFFIALDMQRAMSVNADLREIGDVIKIEKKEKKRLLMPFFAIDELLYQFTVPGFCNFYWGDYLYRRADENLMMYLVKNVVAGINTHYVRANNRYSCITEHITINETLAEEYYIMPKKVHSGVYASDGLSGFFDKKNENSSYGVSDIRTYKTIRADVEELEYQNSYFVRDWLSYLKNGSEGVSVKE